MELLDYQLDDIRRALYEYVEKFAYVKADSEYALDHELTIKWHDCAHERAALIELCTRINEIATGRNQRKFIELWRQGVMKIWDSPPTL